MRGAVTARLPSVATQPRSHNPQATHDNSSVPATSTTQRGSRYRYPHPPHKGADVFHNLDRGCFVPHLSVLEVEQLPVGVVDQVEVAVRTRFEVGDARRCDVDHERALGEIG